VPQELVASIKRYLSEVNKGLGLDRAKKQDFAAKLAKHPWFPHTGYEVPETLAEMFAEMGSVGFLDLPIDVCFSKACGNQIK